MTFEKYQMLASRTQNDELSHSGKLRHALFGMASECGEIHSIYQKQLQGHEVYEDEVAEELGDLLWFCAELADCIGMDLGDVAEMNIAKLRKRYPEGFDADRSINREA